MKTRYATDSGTMFKQPKKESFIIKMLRAIMSKLAKK